jgi:2-polyprenyl-6-hydroxyphenyl methylase/3-demethylubiquinone-9 3-methyltransferase
VEVLEVVRGGALTVRGCGDLLKPGGHAFFATINRNPKAYAFAVVGAEYVLKLLPRGTHDYAKFVKPSELARMCREADITISGTIGMTYNPLTRVYALGRDTDVNYILHGQKN